MEDAVKQPTFFKFFMAEHSSERMKIPPAFLGSMKLKGRRTQAVSLTGPSGDSWTISLIKEEGALYFGAGWPEFVEDHSIQTGDFLVFQYDGEAGFKVRVFDPTMSPREASFHARNPHRVTTESMIRSDGVMLVKEESDRDGARGSSGTDRFSFQITIKAYNVKNAVLEEYVNVVLCEQGGRRWPVSMLCRKHMTMRESWYLSKGLTAFIRDNQVKEGDTCTFELVTPSLLQVRISRA